tara:strand:- start:40 stop:768 length:729 start_codon:yes stop_codon:yes gene_type:complete
MINDVYLYFSDDFTKTKASTTTADQDIRVVDGAPFVNMPVSPITLADAQSGKGWFHKGMAKLHLNTAHFADAGTNDDHLFGTHYGTIVDDQTVIEVHPNAITYAEGSGDGDLHLATVAEDAVFGITQSSTAGENGFTLTLLKPYAADQALVKPASQLFNIEAVDATNTLLTFKPTTGDTGALDKVTLTHASNKHHLLAKSVADVLTDGRNHGKLIKFADAFNEVYFDGNPAGIITVTFAIDA